MNIIKNEKQYNEALEKVNMLMSKGEDNISDTEVKQVRDLSFEIQTYEKAHYPFPMPESVTRLIELKMLEKNLNQVKLANELKMAKSKLSQILNGKRKPDVAFLKVVHEKLQIDGNLLLEKA